MLGGAAARDWTRVYQLSARLDEDGNVPPVAPPLLEGAEGAGAREWATWLTGCSHDHAAERRVYEMPRAGQLACCAVYRRTGNMYFAEGNYERALERYRRALVYYEYAFADDLREQLALHRVQLACLLNTASCCLRLGRLDDATASLSQALALSREALDDIEAALRGGSGGERGAPGSGGAASDRSEPFSSSAGSAGRRLHGAALPAPVLPSREALETERRFCCRSRVKALYRRAEAAYLQNDYDAAAADCVAAEGVAREGLALAALPLLPAAAPAPVQEGCEEEAASAAPLAKGDAELVLEEDFVTVGGLEDGDDGALTLASDGAGGGGGCGGGGGDGGGGPAAPSVASRGSVDAEDRRRDRSFYAMALARLAGLQAVNAAGRASATADLRGMARSMFS